MPVAAQPGVPPQFQGPQTSIPNQVTPLSQGINDAIQYAQANPGSNPFGGLGVSAVNGTPQDRAAYEAAHRTGAPQPQPDMTPGMEQYINQFRQSQANQQQAINAGLMQAIQGLGQRRDAAANLVAALPGQYNTIQNEANQNAGLSASIGQTPGAPTSKAAQGVLGANEQLITNANNAIGAAGKQAAPLLQMGVAADYSKGRTALANTQMQNQGAIADRQAQFDEQMALAKLSGQQDLSKIRLESSLAQGNNPNSKNSIAGQEAFLLWQQQHGMLPKANNPTTVAQDQAAIQKGYPDWATMQNAGQGPFYDAVVQAFKQGGRVPLAGAPGVTIHGDDKIALIHQVQQSNPYVLRTLIQQGIVTPKMMYDAGLGPKA